ncbi:MAG: putative GTP cyclohydrolase [Alyxoria varia]|nr:MAG: putative GTP cyclohydrolase [Alyxoria varia]
MAVNSDSDKTTSLLNEIVTSLRALQQDHAQLSSAVDAISGKVNVLANVKQARDASASTAYPPSKPQTATHPPSNSTSTHKQPISPEQDRRNSTSSPSTAPNNPDINMNTRTPALSSKIILTSYPNQSGVNPLSLQWGHPDPAVRGPVICSRSPSTISRRNAIGAHGGSYSMYYALAVASKDLGTGHKPDYTNTEPAAAVQPNATWGDPRKIVAMDPYGHLGPWLYKNVIEEEGVEVRPTIAVTRAHMKLPELEDGVRKGRLKVDGKICVNEQGELAVTKFAVEPVWYLPGVAARFGIDEGTLRRSLFENTGGSYPELITRSDMKVFLPPIGGLTVYCFGDPAKMSDPNVRLALRVHDECNGSDVFGSDICTCRPYLIFGVEEAVKEAQSGGSGVVIYFRKEGRALGEVTKYLVYNARKRGSDKASEYFKRTENIAGVKDMRFQALMPDVSEPHEHLYDSWTPHLHAVNIGKSSADQYTVQQILHWLGIKKIDRMLSMSNMKHDAIVDQGIPIHERVPIPDEMIPEDSRVEIDAKIHAGYCK